MSTEKKEINSITFETEKSKGVPLYNYNLKFKFIFIEGNAVFVVFIPFFFPFSIISWVVFLVVLYFMYKLNKKRLPTWQFFRYFHRRFGPRIVYPNREQSKREKRDNRPWPF